ncbi:ATP-binding protein [Flammeovirga sp. SJP92]|uniref:sensor histidine kinase n=1 Tax=Flammeovirga sp. SJP92 TaxID=1775430 RepID=UPI000786E9BC|nr:ATP-binding protein [Flammeovirga sp. SJP92]KXX70508.1 hypothetical protein AVL50_08405 [Flammeovirga sp. SJP92]
MYILFTNILLLLFTFNIYAQTDTNLIVSHCTLSGFDIENLSTAECSDENYGFLDTQYHKITIHSTVAENYVLRFNYILFEDLELWKVDRSGTTLLVDMKNNSKPTTYDRSLGLPILFKMNGTEVVNFYYRINNKGFPVDNLFWVMTEKNFLQEVEYEESIKLTTRTIVISLLFIGAILGLIIKEKLFIFYTLSAVSAFLFFETESGLITNYLSHEYFDFTKYLLITSSYAYAIFTFYFYVYLIFNNTKKIPKYTFKIIHVIGVMGIVSFLMYPFTSYYPNTVNFIVAQLSILAPLVVTFLYLIVIVIGIKEKESLAIPTLVIFVVTSLFVIIFSVLPNMGAYQKFNITRTLYFIIFTINIIYYLLLILKKTSSIIQERNDLQIQNQLIQQKYSLAVIKGQEDERNRIGRELHDHVGGNLALINKSKDLDNDNVKEILKHTIKSVRSLSHGLVSPEYDKEDFEDILLDMCAKYKSNGLNIHVNYSIDIPIKSQMVKNHCYRILQELFSNAIKHSKSTDVFIDLMLDNETHKMSIFYEDNGVGFNTCDVNEGIGLKNIKFRVNALNANVAFSSEDKGTFITISNIYIYQ